MRYTSTLGCLFYYDRVLYSWRICEPTMLFLLGLEAITTYDNSKSDTLTMAQYTYFEDVDEVVKYNKFNVFDDIHDYLSSNGTLEDNDTYLTFNCYGLKLLMNELTGTGKDRTVPIIFHNDINQKLVEDNSDLYRIPENEYINKSIYDLQAQKIRDIFTDAGYNKKENEIPFITAPENASDDLNLKNYVNEYNANLKKVWAEKLENGSLYKLLDYQAMYSYALGVLYGCRCLGFDGSLIWRTNPRYWYNGEYFNLVSTAWYTFRFCYTSQIPDIDSDEALIKKYKSSQVNKVWNFENDGSEDSDGVKLESDEMLVYGASINPDTDELVIEPITYSKSVIPENTKGSYYDESDHTWKNIEDKLSANDPLKGIFYENDDPIIRYISQDQVIIRKAYCCYTDNENPNNNIYLSPGNTDTLGNTYRYFIGTGNFGWIDFNENQWMQLYDDNTDMAPTPKNILTFNPITFDKLQKDFNDKYIPSPNDNIGWAWGIDSGIEVSYYRVYIYNNGIYDRCYRISCFMGCILNAICTCL